MISSAPLEDRPSDIPRSTVNPRTPMRLFDRGVRGIHAAGGHQALPGSHGIPRGARGSTNPLDPQDMGVGRAAGLVRESREASGRRLATPERGSGWATT